VAGPASGQVGDDVTSDGTDPSGAAGGEVSLDEAIAIAILFQKTGRLADAERVHRAILAVAPDHPAALHFAGVLAHQQGRNDEALALIGRSLEADPGQADWHSNLGIVLKAEGRLDEAVAACDRAIALDPGHANARNNLGTLLKALRRFVEAEAAYRAAIRLNPDHAEAYHNLGSLLVSQRRTLEGIDCFNKATVLSPETKETRRLLALAHCALGERHKAVEIFERWLQEEPDSPIARHMRAACSGEAVPERADDAYVEKIFDDFAASFDAKLAQLSYRAPQLVAAMLQDAGVRAAGSLDVLDAGCGTGLCGRLMRPYARHLVGVDLSGRMLAQARTRNVYDDLCKAELTGYLRDRRNAFDVIVSADTLVYFGSLADVVAAAATALRPAGWLIFTVEEASADQAPLGYELQTHGRYGHAREYVAGLLRDAGFRSAIVPAELRMESGRPVAGLVVRASRPAAETVDGRR
jgi:predicted TPR repeat methyltransferase